MVNGVTSSFLAKSFVFSVLAVSLAACVGGGPRSGLNKALTNKGDPSRTIDVSSLRKTNNICPPLVIKNGTGALTAYAKNGEDGPRDIVHQATMTKSARECSFEGGNVTLRVGASGRALIGPKGTSNNIDLPIRIVVVKQDGVEAEQEVLFTKLYPTPVQVGSAASPFSFLQEGITVPAPTENNYQIFVGFDTGA